MYVYYEVEERVEEPACACWVRVSGAFPGAMIALEEIAEDNELSWVFLRSLRKLGV